jgi:DNA (cytosine-5)-methyltransferase 1
MKILNLYAGIGGNRKLWGDEHEITAVEIDSKIASIYQDFFPKDKIIIADAHQYLLDHYQEYDFIWSSPPCPSHSRFNLLQNEQRGRIKAYPDMVLYQEIILLKHWFKGKFCVENVISYYDPLIQPIQSNNHYYWTNFLIPSRPNTVRFIRRQQHNERLERITFDLSKFKLEKRFEKQVINNCVEPEVGKQILDYAINPIKLQKELAI